MVAPPYLHSLLKSIHSTAALVSISLSLPPVAFALPVPDATLGTQNIPLGPTVVQINGGTTVGQNLFHSFASFDIDTGEAVFFASPADINHIFSRVTGDGPSTIDGLLGTIGSDADLFLMNPNGVMFGPNASLNVQGSFIVTTADIIGFGETGRFSAGAPVTDQLLAIDPSVFLFSGPTPPAAITSQSRINTGVDASGAITVLGLRVPENSGLVFLGGDIALEGGGVNAPSGLYAPGGRIELGAIADNGAVEFNAASGTLTLPESLERADITLSNHASIRTFAEAGGDISVYTDDLELSDFSVISTGIVAPIGTIGGQAGKLLIDSTGTVTVDQSTISSVVAGVGEGGDVTIRAENINLLNGGSTGTAGIGTGSAGNVTLEATNNIVFSGQNPVNGSPSGLLASVVSLPGITSQGDGGNILLRANSIDLQDRAFIGSIVTSVPGSPITTGDSGDIVIITNDLSMQDGSQIRSSSGGSGNAGDIVVTANNNVIVTGAAADENIQSGLFSTVEFGAQGSGGDITVNARRLDVLGGAVINASTSGIGDTGNVTIDIQDSLLIDGATPINQRPSLIGGEVSMGATGNGNLVRISAETLAVRNGGGVSAGTFGNGSAGDIEIDVRDIIVLEGTNADETWQSNVSSAVGQGAQGTGGDITINANSLNILEGAVVNASTFGTGDTGSIVVNIQDSILIDGTTPINQFPGGIGGEVVVGATGNGNLVRVSAKTLAVRNGGLVSAGTFGNGSAGDIEIDVRDTIVLEGANADETRRSGIASVVGQGAQGTGGDITINAHSLDVLEGAVVNTSTIGTGDTGSIVVNIQDSILIDGTTPITQFPSGIGGEVVVGATGNSNLVRISAETLAVRNGGLVSAGTFGNGSAGDIEIDVRDTIVLEGANADETRQSGIASVVGQGVQGTGGDITINANSLDILEGAVVNASTFGIGDTGVVTIDVQDSILIDGTTSLNQFPSGISGEVFVGAIGNGNLVRVSAETLAVRNGGFVSAATFGDGSAGDVEIDVRDTIVLEGANADETRQSGVSSVVGQGAQGNGGNLRILAETLQVLDGALVTASVFGTGTAGNVVIDTQGGQTVVSGATSGGLSSLILSRLEAGGEGRGGNVRIDTDRLEISNTAAVSASTQGRGNAGDVVINARESIDINSVIEPSTVVANTSGVFTRNFNLGILGTGAGGDIVISTPELTLREGGVLDAQTANDQSGGDIQVDVDSLSLLQGGQILVASSGSGSSGTVRINARENVEISGTDPGFAERSLSLAALGENYEPESSISSISLGTGSTGNIIINSPTLVLTDEGELVAESATVDGGDIILNLEDLLLLRNGSQITATAGIAQGEGRGGNITINSPFIVAIPSENSDITANAFAGSGGQVRITADGIFGIEPRSELTPLSDITASSALGVVGGSVTLNSPDTSFIQNSLTELPDTLVNSDTLVASSCVARNQETGGTFIITGNNLANAPNTASPIYTTGTVQTPNTNTAQSISQAAIVEPTAIYQTANGRLIMSRECS
ncbi:filamentous hemagglutinin family outer membrane protein [Leptolyngbya sp. Heron Island J]|uniref:beta strand repeat-containing protein n=1 Tax=Leptolyngbya sp. Heron Island J TaxID=1385935 RepID=UPI0003B9AF58|nr:filamentous hemagglutinin N-terminal domain-containing protein [Leptolyngbya sp. Heron Island J]ESA34058.1 filamentous hemagglutinin family outer membrane protein [Leptolyngbya sp. Heron Island J]